MASLKEFMGLFGVIIGSLLTFWVKTLSDNKIDNRKLNGLLYFLLQLRYFLSIQQKTWEDTISKKVEVIKAKIPHTSTQLEDEKLKDIINSIKIVAENNEKDISKIEYFENNIEAKFIELAEIAPIMAYEISEDHKIKDKIRLIENYINAVAAIEPGSENFLNEYLKPKIINDILRDIDESIFVVAKRISRKTLKESKEKISLLKETYKPKEFKEIDDIFRNFGFEM